MKKKFLAVVLCLSLVLSTFASLGISSVMAAEAGPTVSARYLPAGVDVNKKIDAADWGDPVIRVDKNSDNASLHNYGGTAEDTYMDIYLGWSKTNLYLGVASPDNDLAGTDENEWEGDGIQFKLSAGNSVAADALNIYFTLAADKTTVMEGESSASYKNTIIVDGGIMYATVEIPFTDLGMTGSDIKAGAELAIDLVRISGTAATGGHYAGWLVWGAFWEANGDNNPDCYTDNVIKLSNETFYNGAAAVAQKAAIAPDMNSFVTEESWGAPAITVNKNSYNCDLHDYDNGTQAEDCTVDFYFQYDDTNLYIGMVADDPDLKGHNDPWAGDGIQFKLNAGNVMTADALNVYFTLGGDHESVTIGNNNGHEYTDYNLVKGDGKYSCAIAVPFEYVGMTASDIKPGAELSFSAIRISCNSASLSGGYAGWLAWGAFFGVGSANNPACFGDNVIVLGDDVAENGRTVKAHKTDSAINVNDPITYDVWGVPAITVTKDSYNVDLHDYDNGTKAEDCKVDFFFRYDDTNLYIGMVTDDPDLKGHNDPWAGDGIQFKLNAGKEMTADALNVYFTLGGDHESVTIGNNNGHEYTDYKLIKGTNQYSCAIAVPFEYVGMTASDIKDGAELAFSVIRISCNSASLSGGYAGWLAWGAFFGLNSPNNPSCVGDNVIVLSEEPAATNMVEAQRLPVAPVIGGVINEDSWGKPAIRIDKNSFNTTLAKLTATPDDTYADLYFRWDDENLYVGMASPDNDFVGGGDPREGDGIQFRVSAGNTMNMGAKAETYFCFNKDKTAINSAEDDFEKGIAFEDGILYTTTAIPFAAIGMTGSDIKAGAKIAIDLLRVSGTSENCYAGFLVWGKFFDMSTGYNNNAVSNNVIVLSNELAEVGTVVEADKAAKAPDVKSFITEETWGKPAISINKDSFNADLHDYDNGTKAEDCTVDFYFQYDDTNLYIGMVADDPDLKGHNAPWAGDGIQFKLNAGNVMTADALNVYFTLGGDHESVTIGNYNGHEYTNYSLVKGDGKYSCAIAVPFEFVGMTASDIKPGAELSFSAIRISCNSASLSGGYAGWLAWGAFFGLNSPNNPSCTSDNVIVLGNEIAKNPMVVTAEKTASKINVKEFVTDKAWGAPAITVNKDSYNCDLHDYDNGTKAEDCTVDFYFRYDDTNLYIGMVSDDPDLKGHNDPWAGDGIQFKLNAGNVMTADALNVYFTLGGDHESVTIGNNNGHEYTDYNLVKGDGKYSCAIAVPFEYVGMTASDIKDGAMLSFSAIRISCNSASLSGGYAGWLAWGPFFGIGSANNPNCVDDNIIVLKDTASQTADEEAGFESLLTNINKTAAGLIATDYIAGGHKIVTTENGTYVVYIDSADIRGDKVNEFTLIKLGTDGSAKEVGYGYTYEGNVDLLATADGTIYVTAGSSSWDIESLYTGSYKNNAERATMTVWKYTEATGLLQSYSAKAPFQTASADGFGYLTSNIDSDNNLIYLTFKAETTDGKTVLETFSFDTAAGEWTDLVEDPFIYEDGGVDTKVVFFGDYLLNADVPEGERILDITTVETKDGYVSYTLYEDGTVYIYKFDGEGTGPEKLEIAGGSYAGMKATEAGLYVIAIDPAKPAEATVLFAEDGLTFTTVATILLDMDVHAISDVMIARADNGSVDNGSIQVMFGGLRGITRNWYYVNIDPEAIAPVIAD